MSWVPPRSIPNLAVKPSHADGSTLFVCKSKFRPFFFSKRELLCSLFFYFYFSFFKISVRIY